MSERELVLTKHRYGALHLTDVHYGDTHLGWVTESTFGTAARAAGPKINSTGFISQTPAKAVRTILSWWDLPESLCEGVTLS